MSFLSRRQRPPSWFEVILGAALSVALGIIVGGVYLASRPVKTVGDVSKDAPQTATVTYTPGLKGFYSQAHIDAKKKEFLSGEAVTVTESELNVLSGGPPKPPPAPTPKNTITQAPVAPPPKAYDIAPLNVRIHDGKLQLAEVYTMNDYGISASVVVQASGDLVKNGDTFEFEPDAFYVGCCPLQRIPVVRAWLLKRILFVNPFPTDLSEAWSRLGEATLEGSKLRLKLQ